MIIYHLIFDWNTKNVAQGWNDYFKNSPTQVETLIFNSSSSTHSTYEQGCVYIKNSLFEDLKKADKGGGIYISTTEDDSKFLVEDSQFVRCSAINNGGGIFKESRGDCVLSRVCGFECTTETKDTYKDGLFCQCDLFETSQNKNCLIEAQVSHCTSSVWGYTISLHYGSCKASKLNASQNYCVQCSAFLLQPTFTIDGLVEFTSLTNNTSTGSVCCEMQNNNNCQFTNSNILYNTQLASNNAIINLNNCKTTVKNTCVIGNKPPEKVFGGPFGSNSFTLRNCTIDDNQMSKTPAFTFNTNSIKPERSFVNALKLLNTGNCYGTYDNVGTLSPIIPTPERTPQQTKNIYAQTCFKKTRKINVLTFSFHLLKQK